MRKSSGAIRMVSGIASALWNVSNGRAAAPPCLLVLPGSRSGEVGRHLDLFGAALARCAERVGEIDAVVFLRDPMTPQPHEPDIHALVRACDVHDVPCATNASTARLLLDQLLPRAASA